VIPEPGAFRPERVRRPREQVELQIRQAILTGQFAQGDRLPSETELAKDFSVSRSTIREALRALATAGLISTTPGASGGSFVEGFDHHSLAASFAESVSNIVQLGSLSYGEVAEVRAMLEIPSARLAARNRRDEHLERLERITGREKSIDVSDPAVPELNVSFHEVVADASGNRLLAALVSALHTVTHPLAFIDTSPDLGRQSVIQHLRIVKAISERDEEKAVAGMDDHLRYLREHVAQAGEPAGDLA
jgi:GntR family transcriptional repressor for pyruvate dehydrogenase complex